MTDFFLFERLATARLKQRCVKDADGNLWFKLKDRRNGVRLTYEEWDNIGQWYKEEIKPSAQSLRWSPWLVTPLFFIPFMFIHRWVPGVKPVIDTIEHTAPGLLLFVFFLGYPIYSFSRHCLIVSGAIEDIYDSLAVRRSEPLPAFRPQRSWNILELVALVIVGPHLGIQLWGTLDPRAFQNTPWESSKLSAVSYVGFAVMILIALLRWRRHRSIVTIGSTGIATTHKRSRVISASMAPPNIDHPRPPV